MPRRRNRAGAGRRGKSKTLSAVSTDALHQELQRRIGLLDELVKARDEISARLDALTASLEEIGLGTASGGRGRPRASAMLSPRSNGGKRGRPRNPNNLVESLRRVLTGKTYSVTDVSEAVQKAGYKTTSPNFRTIVNQALISNPKIFKKVARGQYTAQG